MGRFEEKIIPGLISIIIAVGHSNNIAVSLGHSEQYRIFLNVKTCHVTMTRSQILSISVRLGVSNDGAV